MATATVTSKGQITVPREVRRHLKLRKGDRVDFVIEPGGRVYVRAAQRSIEELYGFLHHPGQRAVSVEEMNAAIGTSRAAGQQQVDAHRCRASGADRSDNEGDDSASQGPQR